MRNGTIKADVRFKLYPPTRWLLLTAATAANMGLPVPCRLIKWICARS